VIKINKKRIFYLQNFYIYNEKFNKINIIEIINLFYVYWRTWNFEISDKIYIPKKIFVLTFSFIKNFY